MKIQKKKRSARSKKKMTPLSLEGVGIDILSLKRVKRLFQHHSENSLRRLFSHQENELYHKKIGPRDFAKHFAAKEAFFKSLGESWLGLEGFRNISIQKVSRTRFEAETQGFFSSKRISAEGSYFESGDMVGAQVLRLKNSKI